MKVTVGDKVVYSVDPATAAKDWRLGDGQWKWDGDVLRQTSDDQNCRALVGDPDWTDFTYTLKARKLSGDGRVFDSVPRQRRQQLDLVERRRLGQHPHRHTAD